MMEKPIKSKKKNTHNSPCHTCQNKFLPFVCTEMQFCTVETEELKNGTLNGNSTNVFLWKQAEASPGKRETLQQQPQSAGTQRLSCASTWPRAPSLALSSGSVLGHSLNLTPRGSFRRSGCFPPAPRMLYAKQCCDMSSTLTFFPSSQVSQCCTLLQVYGTTVQAGITPSHLPALPCAVLTDGAEGCPAPSPTTLTAGSCSAPW